MCNVISGIPNRVTQTLVCIDAIVECDYAGKLYNPYLSGPVEFQQIKDLLVILERFFNDISFPQRSFESRSFLGEKPEQREAEPLRRYHSDEILAGHRGDLATFELQVRYRQNATWQGELRWREEGRHQSFRSTLEMIKMMDNVIQHSTLAANV